MERIVINPENYQSRYIEHLNESFGHWGGEKEYNWGLARKVGEHSSDIIIIENEEDGVIAGSAVSYRSLSKDSVQFDIGIMTGSWTLPAARRKGCFTKMIRSSNDLCQKKSVPLLTAFVTETNASSRRLEAEGSTMIPTFHLFSPEQQYSVTNAPSLKKVDAGEEVFRQIFRRFEETQKPYLSFQYSFSEFKEQYLERVKQITILSIGEDFALLEKGNNEVKILLLTFTNLNSFQVSQKLVANWCLENEGLKSFYFTTRKELASACQDLEFSNLPGFFTVLESQGKDEFQEMSSFQDLHINMADKM